MTWSRFDDAARKHPKALMAGNDAWAFWCAAIMYSNQYGTDGFIPDAALATEVLPLPISKAKAKALAERLCTARVDPRKPGLFTRDDTRGGYIVNDFLDWNPSKSETDAKRKKDRERKKLQTDSETDSGKDSTRNTGGVATDSGSSTRVPARVAPAPAPSPPGPPLPTVPPQPAATGAAADGRVRCPVPLPIPDEDLAGYEISPGIPVRAARGWLEKWARTQHADVTDVRHVGKWVKSGVAALLGTFSGDRGAVLRYASAEATPAEQEARQREVEAQHRARVERLDREARERRGGAVVTDPPEITKLVEGIGT